MAPRPPAGEAPILLGSVFVIATCGLLYELLLGTVTTYFLGSSVLHFSVTIGLFLTAMGIGSYLSRFIQRNLLDVFLSVEWALGILGAISAMVLHSVYSLPGMETYYYPVFVGWTVLLGTLIGLEIPILTRLLRRYGTLRDTVARVLSVDYIGALAAALLFPLVLLPWLGTLQSSFVIGLVNLIVALVVLVRFWFELQHRWRHAIFTVLGFSVAVAGLSYSPQLVGFYEQLLYEDEVILSEQTPYQKIVLTHWRGDYRLYLDGALQFSSVDEYRYHETLVNMPAVLWNEHRQVLILGGGDGLAARELFARHDVDSLTLVDLDPRMTQLARRHPVFLRLNDSAMLDPRVKVVHQDAFKFLEQTTQQYDLILIDLPDPHDVSVSRLYSKSFYQLVHRRLRPGGNAMTQATSPFFAADAFWCIVKTAGSVFDTEHVAGLQADVPSFGGTWGFVLMRRPHNRPSGPVNRKADGWSKWATEHIWVMQHDSLSQPPLRYLSAETAYARFQFTPDMKRDTAQLTTNTLENHALVAYYADSWRNW